MGAPPRTGSAPTEHLRQDACDRADSSALAEMPAAVMGKQRMCQTVGELHIPEQRTQGFGDLVRVFHRFSRLGDDDADSVLPQFSAFLPPAMSGSAAG